VIGFDRDQNRCESLNLGATFIGGIPQEDFRTIIDDGRFRATKDSDALDECDVVTICVSTPLTPSRDPDLSFVRAASHSVAADLEFSSRFPKLVTLESTSYPGTTEEVVMPILTATDRVLDEDFFLAFSPERIDPGNSKWNIGNIPKLVGGVTALSGELAALFYRQFICEVMELSSSRAAEMAKLLENIFRAVNIALVNELWMLCDRMGIDVWEVITAAATKPFGYMTFWPGPGLGGHCIPVDPFYLSWKAREFGFPTEFIELAGKVNINMPYFVESKVIEAPNMEGKCLKGSQVLVLGVAYKTDSDDTRGSPAYRIMSLLRADGASLVCHDPYVESFEFDGEELRSEPLTQIY
jgi:UDP-N-acetyl-D-glucosamine dehydrogenase